MGEASAPRFLRGAIYWARMPRDKRRPALVISPAARNDSAADVIVVPILSVTREGPWHVRLSQRESKLAKRSVAKCELIMTIPKRLLEPKAIGGPLAARRMAEVERGIMRAIGIAV